jgi:general secretion pathway protein K
VRARSGARPVGNERGVALVIVLIVLSLLLTIAGEFAAAMRVEGTTTLNFRAAVTSAYLAEAGYQRAVVESGPEAIAHYVDQDQFVFRRSRIEVVRKPLVRQDIALGPGRFSYRISDEESRLNLNQATPDQLGRLLQELGVEREARDVIVDSIQDWRDANEEHRLNGAESDYYQSLPVPYKSKNGPFDSVDELRQVRGVTPQIFFGTPDKPGLGEYLTVDSAGRVINVNTASDLLLRAFGYAQAEVDQLKQGRPYLDLGNNFPSNLRRAGLSLTVKSTTFRIEATGEVPGQGRRTLRAIVQRQGGQGAKVGLKSWTWMADEESRP